MEDDKITPAMIEAMQAAFMAITGADATEEEARVLLNAAGVPALIAERDAIRERLWEEIGTPEDRADREKALGYPPLYTVKIDDD